MRKEEKHNPNVPFPALWVMPCTPSHPLWIQITPLTYMHPHTHKTKKKKKEAEIERKKKNVKNKKKRKTKTKKEKNEVEEWEG